MAGKRIYMDWNATAPLDAAARDAVLHALDMVGNPSSVHGEGRAARARIEAARRQVASLCAALPAHVVFTSGATEAANLVLTPNFRMGRAALHFSRLYVSAIEHPALREGGRFTRDAVTEVPVTPQGVVNLSALEVLMSAHDRAAGLPMVAIMLVNNETGIIQPVSDAARIVHAAGGLLVVDCVQAAGRVSLDMAGLDADFVILSSHKIGGPKGAGALVSRGEILMPMALIHGGGQEKGHRSGTENLPAVIGFGAAAERCLTEFPLRNDRMLRLRHRLEEAMCQAAVDVMIHGACSERVSNTTFFTLPGLKAETGQIAFDLEGVALSAGAACSSGKVGESHVLTAMGLDPKLGALRISIGPDTSDEDIDKVIEAFAKIAARRKPVEKAAYAAI